MNFKVNDPLPFVAFDTHITNVCKGVAIVMLLCHHLFPVYGEDISRPFRIFGVSGKLCVAIFCFLSGFGLMETRCSWRIQSFRLVRLLLNFWFLAVPFIVVSCVFTARGFSSVYPPPPYGLFKFITDMLGLTTSETGFNPTWWFVGAIVPLYIVFPVLRRMVLLSAILSFLVVLAMWLFGVRNACWWLPFVAGMVAAKTGVFERTTSAVKVFDGICAVLLMPVIVCARYVTGLEPPLEMVYAGLFIYLIFVGNCLAVYFCERSMLWLEFLGRHSMNIFFVHTFYYLYFFNGFFKALNPVVGLLALLTLSLSTSCIAEKVKEVVGFNLIINYLKEKLK